SGDGDPRGFFDRALSLRTRRPSESRVRPDRATSRDRSRFVILRRREHPDRPGRSPPPIGTPIGNVRNGRPVVEWIGGRSRPAEAPEQGPDGLSVLLVLDVPGFQDFFDLVRSELVEHGVVHRPEALEFSGIEPDAETVEEHVDADIARILSIHETPAVGADELAVRIQTEVLREELVQAGTSGEGPNLLLVDEHSVAGGADVDFHRATMRVPRLLAQRGPVLRTLPCVSDLLRGHGPRKAGPG